MKTQRPTMLFVILSVIFSMLLISGCRNNEVPETKIAVVGVKDLPTIEATPYALATEIAIDSATTQAVLATAHVQLTALAGTIEAYQAQPMATPVPTEKDTAVIIVDFEQYQKADRWGAITVYLTNEDTNDLVFLIVPFMTGPEHAISTNGFEGIARTHEENSFSIWCTAPSGMYQFLGFFFEDLVAGDIPHGTQPIYISGPIYIDGCKTAE